MTILAQSIPASDYVQVDPGVISAAGSALDLNGVILTQDTAVPIGAVQPFATARAVSDFFGPTSPEYDLAKVYFAGRNNATVTPGNLFFAQYNASAVAPYLRGGSVSGLTLTQLQALSGTITATFDGTSNTSATINLSGATSFSNAASLIQAGFTSPTFTVSYDTQRQAFVFTGGTTGSAGSVAFASGTLADSLYLTQSTGAVLSQGADAQTPAGMMNAVTSQTLDWATFMTTWEPTLSDKLAFANWTNGQGNRFCYVVWDTSVAATQANDTTTIMPQVNNNGYSGICGVYADYEHAAFVMGVTASLDFSQTNGRTNYAYKYTSGLTPSVSDETAANNLVANGYNYIGAVATANQGFKFFYPGQISGEFKWLDTFMDEVYLNSQLQLAMMTLLTNVNFIPYNQRGYTQIHQACMGPINQGLNFGSIVPGVTLSPNQVSAVNTKVGKKVDDVISKRGWYLSIKDATAQTRANRASPPITLIYADGGSVNSIDLASIVVQ